MKVDRLMNREDRLKVAAKIAELSDLPLSTQENLKSNYVALKIESGPYSNAICVHNNRVSFLIRSTDLLKKATEDRLNPEPAPRTVPMDENKFLFWGLGMSDIQAHEALFREIVMESVRTIMDLRPKKK